jgi:hypothetical protein
VNSLSEQARGPQQLATARFLRRQGVGDTVADGRNGWTCCAFWSRRGLPPKPWRKNLQRPAVSRIPPVPRRRCIGVAGKDGRVLLICGRAPSNSETGRWGLKLTSIGSVTGGLSAPRKQRLGERELSATASRRSSKVACYPLIWIKVAALRANGTAERQEA